MPTPSTRTPVRIARGSYSNLNGSVSDLQDGEISYAEDQDKLYIKEGSSLVALTYTPASPAFTGTITGVNLTLSGNLIVNGTTTTINTQTLDVEDKQIEIGKVSSPSDTTADQGGIKLKGATDKTFLWVNSTDAWTSSEHIVLAASKRLLIGTTTEGNVWASNLTIADSNNCGITIRSGTSDNGTLYFSDGTSGVDEYKGYVLYNHSDNSLKLGTNATVALTISSAQAATFASSVTAGSNVIDSKGNVRDIPQNAQSSAYTLAGTDAGKHIYISSGGVTVPGSVYGAGNAVTIINNSGSDQTITQGSGMTMYNTADGSTGNRTLAGRGMATILFINSSAGYISGAGLS